MPVNLSIKGVPDPVAAGLRARAARNHRSLQRELMAIIEVAAATEPARGGSLGTEGGAEAEGVAGRSGAPLRPIEEIFDEWRRLFPRDRQRGPSSAEIIRRMRDGRLGGAPVQTRSRGRSD